MQIVNVLQVMEDNKAWLVFIAAVTGRRDEEWNRRCVIKQHGRSVKSSNNDLKQHVFHLRWVHTHKSHIKTDEVVNGSTDRNA